MQFKLRPFNISDIDSLVKYANNSKIAANLTNQFPDPYTKENGEAFIKMATQNIPITIIAIDINGNASGGIGIHLQNEQ